MLTLQFMNLTLLGLTHELRNNVDASLRDATRTACRRLPQ
ncbi:hypothetical protein GXM_03971 [Nostoc sphaeroides CCNUC1]|uniref:Uncharacterized protein n=1 Tax=Nostoc sphaeroides CCNUC1 TaxID=2653204 RepID=A0A5P8W1F6_9NOSO|nr:hypothetical protein GXM_03971 [Nostoc sphaeroides CCNUC1]